MKQSKLQWKKRWQDALVALLGAWFAVSPWVLDLHASTTVIAASLGLGLALMALAIGAFLTGRRWEHWAEAATGLAVAASPWVLGFSDDTVAWRNAAAVGLISALLALWVMAREKEGRGVLHGTEELAH
jgi:hypothetical protein